MLTIDRRKICLGTLVALHLAVPVFCMLWTLADNLWWWYSGVHLFGQTNFARTLPSWLIPVLVALDEAQPYLFAMWAAFGNTNFAVRFSQALSILLLVGFTEVWLLQPQQGEFALWILVGRAPVFAVSTCVFLAVRWIAKWRTAQDYTRFTQFTDADGRFPLWQLFAVTALAAVTCAVGRMSWSNRGATAFDFSELLTVTRLLWLLLTPAALLPVVPLLLAPGSRIRWLLATPLALASLIATQYVLLGRPIPFYFQQRLLHVSGLFIAVGASLWLVRLAGYRLVRLADRREQIERSTRLASTPSARM